MNMNLMHGTNSSTPVNDIIPAQPEAANGTNLLRDEQTSAPAFLNHSGPGGGALLARHAPPPSSKGMDVTSNRFPRGRWAGTVASMRTSPPLDSLVEAPLRELFWSPPQT